MKRVNGHFYLKNITGHEDESQSDGHFVWEPTSLSHVSVNVSAFGLWQMVLGAKRRRVETKGHTVGDLIATLNEMASGKLEAEIIGDDGRLDPKFKIFVNGRESVALSTQLTDGDDVVLFGVIDGG